MSQDEPYGGVDNLEVMQEAKKYNRFLLDTICRYSPRGGRILDFGAGSGQFAIPMSLQGANITALEPDCRLRERIIASGVHTVARPQDLPPHSIDCIYTINVLEHIADDVKVLQELRSKLTSNGTLLVYVPAFPVLYTSMDRRVGHVRRYTRSSLVSAVTRAGFTVDSVAYVDSLGFLAALLFKVFDDKSGSINLTVLKLYDRLVFPVSRALDFFASRWFGKNLLLIART